MDPLIAGGHIEAFETVGLDADGRVVSTASLPTLKASLLEVLSLSKGAEVNRGDTVQLREIPGGVRSGVVTDVRDDGSFVVEIEQPR